jgi:hypothetical protein
MRLMQAIVQGTFCGVHRCKGTSLCCFFFEGQYCLVLSYTRPVLVERPSLGRAAALLASCPPLTTLSLLVGPACGAGRHPSSPVLLSESRAFNIGQAAKPPLPPPPKHRGLPLAGSARTHGAPPHTDMC